MQCNQASGEIREQRLINPMRSKQAAARSGMGGSIGHGQADSTWQMRMGADKVQNAPRPPKFTYKPSDSRHDSRLRAESCSASVGLSPVHLHQPYPQRPTWPYSTLGREIEVKMPWNGWRTCPVFQNLWSKGKKKKAQHGILSRLCTCNPSRHGAYWPKYCGCAAGPDDAIARNPVCAVSTLDLVSSAD